MVLRNTDIKFLTTFTLLLGFLSSDKNLIYARAYRDYDNYNYGSLNLMSDYGNQELGSRGYYQASAYDRSISKAQNHQLNNINLEMENCDSMPFHEPLICRAARCAIDTATIRKILAQPSQKKQLNEIADYYQMTPLHVSAAYQTNNPYPIVKELITMGANISSTGSLDNRTPVIETGTNKYGGVEAIRALLEDYTPYRRLIQHHARIKDLSMEKKAILRETYSKKEVEKVLSPRSNDDQLEISISSFSDGNDDQEEDPGYVKVVIKGKRTRDPTDHYFKQKALLLATDDMQENVYHVATKNENINLLEYLIEKFPEISEQGLVVWEDLSLCDCFAFSFCKVTRYDLSNIPFSISLKQRTPHPLPNRLPKPQQSRPHAAPNQTHALRPNNIPSPLLHVHRFPLHTRITDWNTIFYFNFNRIKIHRLFQIQSNERYLQ